jgi:hypothetical protein
MLLLRQWRGTDEGELGLFQVGHQRFGAALGPSMSGAG